MYITGGIDMRETTRGNVTIVSRSVMEKIATATKEKYDATKAAKEAKKQLRKQGLKV